MPKLPPDKYSSWISYLKAVLPGILICFILAFIAWRIDMVTPAFIPLNYVLYAIIFGLIIRNVFTVPAFLQEGFKFSAKILLFMGVIFIGGTVNLAKIAETGKWSLVLVIVTITAILLLSSYIGRLMNIEPQARHLIGTGVAICGISAVTALAPVIKAKEKVLLVTVATILIVDVCALLFIPILTNLTNLSEVFGGYLAGSVVANTAQSIAAGFAIGETAGVTATITKTARNALMAVVILVFAYYYTKIGLPVGVKVSPRLLWDKFPKFVLGFLVLSLFTTLGFFWGEETLKTFSVTSKWLFTAAFVGIGTEINFKDLDISDFKPMALGAIMVILLFVIAFLFTKFVIPI